MTAPTAPSLIRVRKRHEVRVEREGPDVILVMDGRVVFRAHYSGAKRVGQSILEAVMACQAEERQLTERGGRL